MLKMTESTISALANKKCRLTGSFWIVDDITSENPNTVAISFATKEQLVNKFGKINDTANNTYIKYQSKAIYEPAVSCQEQINLYLGAGKTEDSFKNAFGLTISDGNDVIILDEVNPFDSAVMGRLNIAYSIKKNSGVSDIDPKTGIITVTGKSDKVDVITIVIKTDGGQTITKTCNLVCSWVAPKLGDFAYADGSFSSAYNPTKTLVGLVYHKEVDGNEGTDSETGTAYIIGKEYSSDTEMYSGINL